MRGAYAAGVLAGLHARGESFEAIHAVSSGACSSAYVLSGQPEGIGIWRDHLDGAKLLRAGNVLRGRPYLDLDYLMDEVFGRRVPLDLAALRAAPAPLWVGLTRAEDGGPERRDLRREADPLRTLKATSALPIAHPRPVELDGRSYLDGAMADPIPLGSALADGADDVTVVLTRPAGYRRPPAPGWLSRLASAPYPGARRAFETMHVRYNAALDLAREPPPGARVRVLAPPPDLRLGRLMRDARDLRAAVERGLRDGMGAPARASG